MTTTRVLRSPIFAADVHSTVTEAECRRLAELAAGKAVLEVGAWRGRSTIALASTADVVHSIDWHRGDEQAGHRETLEDFLANLDRYGVRDRVICHLGRSEDVSRVLAPASFDLVFIDALHTREALTRDIENFGPCLRRGGAIAFHDYGLYEVRDAVDPYAAAVGSSVELTESLAVVRPQTATGDGP